MDVYLVFIVIIALALSSIGLLVITKNAKSSTHRSFFLASVFLALWIVTNFLSNDQDISLRFARVANHLVLATSGLGVAFLLRYIALIVPKSAAYRYRNQATAINIVSSLLSLTPFVVSGITKRGSVYGIAFGPLSNLYFLALTISIVWSVTTLIFALKKSSGIERSRLSVIMMSFILTAGLAAITNIIAPLIGNSFALTNFGPLSVTFLVGGIAYTMIRHQLFDIRLVVARALGYIFSTVVVGALYSSIAFFALNKLVFDNVSLSTAQEFAYTFLALFLAFTFKSIRRFFDTITKRIFYRDAYDSQKVLAVVSSVVVGNIDPHKLQKESLVALVNALRPSYGVFLLNSPVTGEIFTGETIGRQQDIGNMKQIRVALQDVRDNIVVYEDIIESNPELYEMFRAEDIGVVALLVTKNEIIGYLVLGPKKSGNVYTSQDIGLLNIATNELAVALQNAQRFEEIQAFNKTLQGKVAEATQELEVTNKKLIQLDEAKDEFISMASHQLRTPLTSIKGYLSMVVEGDLGPIKPQQEKVLKDAFGSSQRMAYLIADFLNVSRIKTGKFMIEKHEVDLPQIVQEEIRQLEEMAESRDLKLIYEKPGVFPRVKLDENKTRQVMMNMVDNAIYYTPSGGTITIQLYALADEIIFKVVDTGIGVPKKEQHKLFTKFFRAGNAKKARPDGTGLGLFMAQKVVVEQGGAVIFESTEGKGSTFGFRFPLKKIKA
jgi:signal transduction histidine kinase